MRVDDAIDTVLEFAGARDASVRAAVYEQLIDLLAQGRGDDARDAPPLAALARLREVVTPAVRDRAARRVASGSRSTALIDFILDDPDDAATLAASARFDAATWGLVVPRLGPAARIALGARAGGDARIARLIAFYGVTRALLPAPATPSIDEIVAEAPAPEVVDDDLPAPPPGPPVPHPALSDGDRQVRDLLGRIASFRAGMVTPASEPAEPVAADLPEVVEGDTLDHAAARAVEGRWEADRGGVIIRVDGALPAAAIGRSLADGDAAIGALARSMQRRAPFRDVAATLDEAGTDWRLSGVPVFDQRSGRFLGFRGVAHRAARPASPVFRPGLFGTGASSDLLATMAHEVRSPLNAIMGFAQLIDTQLMGPANDDDRACAADILGDADDILDALDDLTDAARLDRGDYAIGQAPVDVGVVVRRVAARHRDFAVARGVTLFASSMRGAVRPFSDERALERALHRLLAAAIAAAAAGEVLRVTVQPGPGESVRLSVTRPVRLMAVPSDELFDPSRSLPGGGPPLTGLGFGMRLVRRLALALGGTLEVERHAFVLALPPFVRPAVAESPRTA